MQENFGLIFRTLLKPLKETTLFAGISREKSQDTQPPLTPRQGLDYRGRVPDASP